ncbi:PleD family two-component system response regulator [Mucilaginibacter ximonensis]|uniref:PleD family two-component system response regulator n=1 Tax=Mucilaginibacter ximonensis TaxID=538021 RepID=A0ABW5Y7Y5_9SPHI
MQRILAIDDDKDILEILQLILEYKGYEVETLADGRHLFETIKQYHPDLIILDIMLGNFDGRKLCSELKSHRDTRDIPVILLSASHTVHGNFHKNGNPDDFIAKPFDIDILLNSVERQLVA